MSFEQPNWLPGEPPPQPNVSPSAAPVPKVIASSAGSGLGGALAVLVVWGITEAGADVPLVVAMAISTICGTLVGFAAGYFTPPRSM